RPSTCQIECMCGGGAHGNAWPHDTYCRQGMRIAIHAPTDSDDVVYIGRSHAAKWDRVHMVIRHPLPVHHLGGVVQPNPPGTARYCVGVPPAGVDVGVRKLCLSDNPAGLTDSGVAVSSDARLGKNARELLPQEFERRVGLTTTLEYHFCARPGFERRRE